MTAASRVTPVVLTFNEEVNLERTLTSLEWAQRVIIVDSGSTDRTEWIARRFPNVSWFVRPFDRHDAQWNFAITQTGITSEYVLALDADMWLPPAFVREIESGFLNAGCDGAMISFDWHFYGRPLNGSLYPTQLRVFRPGDVRIIQPGHTQEFVLNGRIYRFRARAVHDDRKPIERWTNAQLAYSRLERERLSSDTRLRWRDRMRRVGLMPGIALLLTYVRAGGPFRGAAAARYAYERTAYECLLAIRMLDGKLQSSVDEEQKYVH
jgi:glycosyltransferase involved in cell wall biosynthesis